MCQVNEGECIAPNAPRSADRDRSVPWRSATVRVVFTTTLLAPFSVALVSPGLPVFRTVFDLSEAEASLLLTAILLPGVVVSPVLGLLADRIGRRRVLIASLLVWSLAGGAVVLGPPFPVVLALRLLQGTALAGMGIATITLITDVFEDGQRNAILGVNTAVLSAGAAAFPLVGGVLVAVSWTAPFALYLLGLPVAVFAFYTLEEPAGDRESRNLVYLRRAVGSLSLRDATVLYGSAVAIDLLLFGAVFTALPFLLWETYGLSPLLIGLVVTIGEVASTVAATQTGRLSAYLSPVGLVTVGFLATGVGLVGAGLAGSAAVIAVTTVGYGAGWGIVLPSIDAGISDRTPGRLRAGAVSIRNSASSVGRAAGPFLFTALAVGTGYSTLLVVAGIGALGFAAAVAALRR